LLQRGQYEVNIAPNELGMTMDKKTPLAVYEARNAVRIAKAAGADVYATDAFHNAQQLLAQAESKDLSTKERSSVAREAVQRSEDARLVSIKRQEAESLANERQNSKDQIGLANGAATTAALGQAQAETAQAKAELAKATSDASRSAAEATSAAAISSASIANEGRATAEAATAAAQNATGRATAERNVAVGQAQRAEGERNQMRVQLLQQLNAVLQTRDSARGLIVNMSGVLFETGKSDLRPAAREKLSKISGIVLAYPDLKLAVEGHTDNMGSDANNQKLSEKRAEGARDYLVSQGVSANSIVSRGFGSTIPITSNDTAAGRQANRRVELIVSGDAIRIPVKAENE